MACVVDVKTEIKRLKSDFSLKHGNLAAIKKEACYTLNSSDRLFSGRHNFVVFEPLYLAVFVAFNMQIKD